MYKIHLYLFFVILALMIGCTPDQKSSTKKPKISCKLKVNQTKQRLQNGDVINFSMSTSKTGISKLQYAIDGKVIAHKKDFVLNGLTMGQHKLVGTLFFDDSTTCDKTAFLEIISDIEPKEMTFKKIRTIDHDIGSYTQGLEFVDDVLYESTGQYGTSFINSYKVADQKKYT